MMGKIGDVGRILVQENGLGSRIDDLIDVLVLQDRLTVNDHLVTFDTDHLAGILVHEILDPAFSAPWLPAYGPPVSSARSC